MVISFTVNGQNQGIAFEVSHSDLGDQAVYPHIVTKNASFKVSDLIVQLFESKSVRSGWEKRGWSK